MSHGLTMLLGPILEVVRRGELDSANKLSPSTTTIAAHATALAGLNTAGNAVIPGRLDTNILAPPHVEEKETQPKSLKTTGKTGITPMRQVGRLI